MIHLQNLSYRYSRRTPIFESVNVEIQSGITAVVGMNGIGKTTFLKLLAGLLRPTAGSVSVRDYSPGRRSSEFLEQLFFVPDRFELPRQLTPRRYGRHIGALYPRFDNDYFQQLMKSFSINSTERFGKLSLGQQKKFLLALGFATNPNVLLMDEPLSGLDTPSKSIFRELLIDQVSDEKQILISTHELRELPTLLDAVCMMNESEVLSIDLAHAHSSLSQIVSTEAASDAIHVEDHPLGYLSLVPRQELSEQELDIEFLFRAFIAKTTPLRQHLKNSESN